MLVLLGCAVAPPLHAQRPAHDGQTIADARVQEALERARDGGDLRRRLAALGPEALPALLCVLVQGARPAREDARVPSEQELATVREVLCARPRRELLLFLETLAAEEEDPAIRVQALGILGQTGSREQLGLLARLATPLSRGPLPPELREGFGQALALVLQRDPSALGEVRRLFQEALPALSAPIVAALARTRAPEAQELLASLLGSSPGLDPLILTRLGERGPTGRLRIDEEVRDAVRRYLSRREEELVRVAARAAGGLRDDEAVETLVGMTEHPVPALRASACDALGELTGLAYGRDSARWSAWYRAEMSWWDSEAREVLLRIERGRGVEFTRAARLALEHRLFRDRLAEAFAQALPRRDFQEVRFACRALEELRSPSALPGLIECLERDEPLVREAAWKALRAITGAELPAEAESWASFAG